MNRFMVVQIGSLIYVYDVTLTKAVATVLDLNVATRIVKLLNADESK